MLTPFVSDPDYEESNSYSDDEEDDDTSKSGQREVSKVDVDIYLTAFANARKYYDQKRATAAKHEKTIAASEKVRLEFVGITTELLPVPNLLNYRP
jgi:hypothetical protein